MIGLPFPIVWKCRYKVALPADDAALLVYLQLAVSEGRGEWTREADGGLLFYIPIDEMDRKIFPDLKNVKEAWIHTHPILLSEAKES